MTTTRDWSALSPDQRQAMKTAATRLARDFDGVFGQETIERFLHSSFDQFATSAAVTRFLPLLAERFAKQRLQALAKVEGLHNSSTSSTQHGNPAIHRNREPLLRSSVSRLDRTINS